MERSYQINPCPVEGGSGWKLTLFENGQEVGGGIFPPGNAGHATAMETGESWNDIDDEVS
jgi:hypothetical protein